MTDTAESYGAYSAERKDPRFTFLRERAEPVWTEATTHRFGTELDREGAAASERRQRKVARLATRTVELEASFFEAAYFEAPSRPLQSPVVSPDGE